MIFAQIIAREYKMPALEPNALANCAVNLLMMPLAKMKHLEPDGAMERRIVEAANGVIVPVGGQSMPNGMDRCVIRFNGKHRFDASTSHDKEDVLTGRSKHLTNHCILLQNHPMERTIRHHAEAMDTIETIGNLTESMTPSFLSLGSSKTGKRLFEILTEECKRNPILAMAAVLACRRQNGVSNCGLVPPEVAKQLVDGAQCPSYIFTEAVTSDIIKEYLCMVTSDFEKHESEIKMAFSLGVRQDGSPATKEWAAQLKTHVAALGEKGTNLARHQADKTALATKGLPLLNFLTVLEGDKFQSPPARVKKPEKRDLVVTHSPTAKRRLVASE